MEDSTSDMLDDVPKLGQKSEIIKKEAGYEIREDSGCGDFNQGQQGQHDKGPQGKAGTKEPNGFPSRDKKVGQQGPVGESMISRPKGSKGQQGQHDKGPQGKAGTQEPNGFPARDKKVGQQGPVGESMISRPKGSKDESSVQEHEFPGGQGDQGRNGQIGQKTNLGWLQMGKDIINRNLHPLIISVVILYLLVFRVIASVFYYWYGKRKTIKKPRDKEEKKVDDIVRDIERSEGPKMKTCRKRKNSQHAERRNAEFENIEAMPKKTQYTKTEDGTEIMNKKGSSKKLKGASKTATLEASSRQEKMQPQPVQVPASNNPSTSGVSLNEINQPGTEIMNKRGSSKKLKGALKTATLEASSRQKKMQPQPVQVPASNNPSTSGVSLNEINQPDGQNATNHDSKPIELGRTNRKKVDKYMQPDDLSAQSELVTSVSPSTSSQTSGSIISSQRITNKQVQLQPSDAFPGQITPTNGIQVQKNASGRQSGQPNHSSPQHQSQIARTNQGPPTPANRQPGQKNASGRHIGQSYHSSPQHQSEIAGTHQGPSSPANRQPVQKNASVRQIGQSNHSSPQHQSEIAGTHQGPPTSDNRQPGQKHASGRQIGQSNHSSPQHQSEIAGTNQGPPIYVNRQPVQKNASGRQIGQSNHSSPQHQSEIARTQQGPPTSANRQPVQKNSSGRQIGQSNHSSPQHQPQIARTNQGPPTSANRQPGQKSASGRQIGQSNHSSLQHQSPIARTNQGPPTPANRQPVQINAWGGHLRQTSILRSPSIEVFNRNIKLSPTIWDYHDRQLEEGTNFAER